MEAKQVVFPHRALEIAYRQIAINCEQNDRYDDAAKFRYWAMAVRRQERWYGYRRWRHWKGWLSGRWSRVNENRSVKLARSDTLVHWLYWALSGYGERMLRAFVVLGLIWWCFAWSYIYVGFARSEARLTSQTYAEGVARDEVGEPLTLKRALSYSLAVMSLQKPDPKPITNTAQALVTLQTILGPVQAALLALAIRRRFMR